MPQVDALKTAIRTYAENMDGLHGNVGTTETRVKCEITGWYMDEENLKSEIAEQADANPEKTFSQEDVNALAGRLRAKERAKAEQEYLEKLNAERQRIEEEVRQKHQQVANDSYASNETDISSIKQQIVEELRAEEAQAQHRAQLQQIVDGVTQTIAKGREAYGEEAWNEATKAFNPGAYPELSYYIQKLPNGHDVYKEIAENPNQLMTLDYFAKKEDNSMIEREMARLSNSLMERAEKEKIEQENNVNAPLDSLQPSRVQGSNGDASISELRAQPWLRG